MNKSKSSIGQISASICHRVTFSYLALLVRTQQWIDASSVKNKMLYYVFVDVTYPCIVCAIIIFMVVLYLGPIAAL